MSSPIKPIILSPPIGTHLHFDWATSVHGTFTAFPRPGSRILRAMRTLRKVRGGWVNRIGLLNEGIHKADLSDPEHIYSVTAIEDQAEWDIIFDAIPGNRIIELNLGCPNAPHVLPSKLQMRKFNVKCKLVIIKIPPNLRQAQKILHDATEAGISWFHACNTVPTERGGQSGDLLRMHSLSIITTLREKNPDITIIAGGGIYQPDDVEQYILSGADYFSLSTVFFTPWRVPAIKRVIHESR